MTKRLYLVRHASVEGPYRGRYLGRTDVSLSEVGRRQARGLGAALQVYLDHRREKATGSKPYIGCSPMRRCRQTLQETGFAGEPQMLEDLQEIDFGRWDGKSFNEIVQTEPSEVERWSRYELGFRFPEGESLGEFLGRMSRVHHQIIESSENEIILFTHGGVISSLLCLFLGLNSSQYLAFHVERASFASLAIFKNGLGRLTGLNLGVNPESREFAGEWPI